MTPKEIAGRLATLSETNRRKQLNENEAAAARSGNRKEVDRMAGQRRTSDNKANEKRLRAAITAEDLEDSHTLLDAAATAHTSGVETNWSADGDTTHTPAGVTSAAMITAALLVKARRTEGTRTAAKQ
jgi:hypothetical protein